MNKEIIAAVNYNLNQANELLSQIDADTYVNETVGPFFSSIGSHLRHTLDFFNCLIDGLDGNKIDLTARKRDNNIATNLESAKSLIHTIQETLFRFKDINTDYLIHVTDNLGQGNTEINYTLESVLSHANSHMIHHFAMIGYILHALDTKVNIKGFGYNASTPEEQRKGSQ